MQSIAQNDFDLLLLFFWAKRKLITLVVVIGFIMGTILAFLIPPTYKSESSIFVPTSTTLSKVVIGIIPTTNGTGDDLMGFSDGGHIEFYLEILRSKRMRDKVFNKLNLSDYYGIVKNHPNYEFEIQKKFKSNFSFARTPNNAIQIVIEDYNPGQAQLINQAVLDAFNAVRNEIVAKRGETTINHIENEIDSLEKVVIVYAEKMKPYQAKGILDYETQAERLTQGYALALGQGGNIKAIEEKFKLFSEESSAFESIHSDFKGILEVKTLLQQRKIEVKTELGKLIEHKFVIDFPNKPDKKDAPKRSIVILLSTISSFLLVCGFLLFNNKVESLRNANKLV